MGSDTQITHETTQPDNMRSRWNWSRPEPRIYSYNTDPTTFNIGYSSSSSSRSMRASSVAAGAESQSVRSARATTVAPASDNSLSGYSGFFGRQLAQHGNQSSTTSSMKASTVSSKAVTETKSVEKTERSSRKVDMMTEHNQSLEYGKQSRSAALRRAELHAVKSGKDPRHVMVPWNLEDDVCKKVADLHMYDNSVISREGRVKVEKLEKELNALINSSMSYKSSYNKTAKQMAMEAMEACDSEAASSKKIRKTVVESSNRRAVVA